MFTDIHKQEWAYFLRDRNQIFKMKTPSKEWSLTRILEKKRKGETQKDAESCAVVIIGKRPVAVPADLEEQIQAQLEDVPEVNDYFIYSF